MHKTIKKCCRDCVIALLIISLSAPPLAVAAEQDSAEGRQRILKPARQRLRTRITYSCTELPIETVLMELAEQAKIDIVKSPKVTGNVTVKVTDVPLEEALGNILAAHDYTYIATESMIRVVPIPEIVAAREKLITRIYQITYADAHDVASALGDFVSAQGRIAFNKGTSHIIVTDTESKIKGIDKFIEQIDHVTPQVLVEVRIYDITTSEGFELGAEWHAGRNAPYTADTILLPTETTTTVIEPSLEGFYQRREDTTEIPGDEDATTITETTTTTTDEIITIFDEDRTDTRDGLDRGEFTHYTDIREEDSTTTYPEFDVTETVTTPLVKEIREELGGTIDSGRTETENTYVNPSPIITNRRRKPFVGASFDPIRGGTLSFSVLNDAVDIELALNILHKEVEAKLLANPRILVLDNETADFEIVREIPYREMMQVERAAAVTYTEFKDVGVQLKVTPHIARDGMIKLHIKPEFGVVVGFNAEGAPTVDTRRADTVALIKDGQTIAIGGLRKRETSRSISKVPVLGDLPLVGGLFKSETESVEINELIVFITTRIVTEPVLSETEKKQLEATRFVSPVMRKTRLELDRLKRGAEEPEVTEMLDLLLEKL